MKPGNIYDRIAVSLLAADTAATALVYRSLPDPMPTHFDAHGVANGFMPKAVGAWFGVGVAALVYALLRYGAALVPGDWRARMEASPLRLVALLAVVFMSLLHGVILYAGLRAPSDVATALALALGGFWLVLGLVMPRVRRNPFVGIRTTWTLTSDENWARTHRLAGLLMVAAGVVAMIGGLAGSLALGIAAIVTSTLVAVLYSYVLARRLQR